MAKGKKVETDEDDEDDEDGDEEKPPKCYKLDYEDDDTCKTCPWRGPCSTHLGVELHEGHELQEGDRGYGEDPEESEEESEEEDDSVAVKLEELGYDGGQIGRISDAAAQYVINEELQAEWVSVLKNGEVSVITAKLPDGHKLKPKPPDKPTGKPAGTKPKPAGKPASETPKAADKPKPAADKPAEPATKPTTKPTKPKPAAEKQDP